MVEDLSVRDPVPSSDMEKPAQAIQVKLFEFLDMYAAHSPHLTGIQRVERKTTLYTLNLVCAERPS